ncbi:MAG TPA: endonuclease III, partial [Candidatus Aminicenantes bacterium]|nr:endonuclease III [Candidatus Aminicenantes bacterium]
VNLVTPGLFKKYPDARAYAEAGPGVLENDIRSTGFFRNKARNIRGAARKILDDFEGEVPATMDELLTLPGVARKTANIVLSIAFHKNEGIAVDVHVGRVSRRLGLSGHEEPVKIEQDLLRLVPRIHWGDFNFWVVSHGRAVCRARKPACEACPLRPGCLFPSSPRPR